MAVTGMNTFLWFNTEALEAAEFYCSLFPGAEITNVDYYQADAQLAAQSVLTVSFNLFGSKFVALNGGPGKDHNDSVSFQVFCDTQEEVDFLWNGLIADGGKESWCGWCSDKWGIAWQIIPHRLGQLLSDPDGERSVRAFQAMRTMQKIDIQGLEDAVNLA